MRESTLRSAAWLVGSNVLRLGVAFSLIPLLTRLLSPQDYGLFNFAFPIILALICAADLGYATVLVRSRSAGAGQDTAVFLISIAGSAALSVLLILSSETISEVTGQPDVGLLLRECTIVLILGALCSAPFARLQREGRMRGFAIGDVIGVVGGGIVAIVAAWNGAGVHSLVLQQAASMLVRLATAVSIGKFVIKFGFNSDFMKQNFRFALYAAGSNVVGFFSKIVDSLLIGYILGFYSLGLYSIAIQIIRLPEAVVVGPIYAALLPAFSHGAEERHTFGDLYLAAMFLVFTFCMSTLCGLALVSFEIVDILLGNRWEDSAPILRILAIYAFGTCVSIVQQAALIGAGNANTQLQISSGGTIVIVILLLAGSQWGILGVALGVSLSSVLVALASILAVCRLQAASAAMVCRQAWIPLASAIAMAAAIQIGQILISSETSLVRAVILIPIGAMTFVFIFVLLGGYHHLRNALSQFRTPHVAI